MITWQKSPNALKFGRAFRCPWEPMNTEGGVNFAIFSRHASRVRLELFDHPADATPARVIDLDPARNRTGDMWHVWVEGIRAGQLYAYRVDGPYQPRDGIVSISTSCSWTPLQQRSRRCLIGILAQRGDTIRLRQSKTWLVRKSMMPQPCRNACSLTSISTGRTTGRPGIPGQRQ